MQRFIVIDDAVLQREKVFQSYVDAALIKVSIIRWKFSSLGKGGGQS